MANKKKISKDNSKKSEEKIEKNHIKNHTKSKLKNSQNPENQPYFIRNQNDSSINYSLTLQQEQNRRIYCSNQNRGLTNYFLCYMLGEMGIFNRLFSGVESQQIYNFLSGQIQVFIKMLLLTIGSELSLWSTIHYQNIDFGEQHLYQIVPKTLQFGLENVRQQKGLKPNSFLKLKEKHIKSLYFSSILLINVGQINKKTLKRSNQESTLQYFHRITTYLLDKSTNLTQKMFYMIRDNWDGIMSTVRNQYKIDQISLQKNMTLQQNYQHSFLTVDQNKLRKQIDQQIKKSLQQEQKKEKLIQIEEKFDELGMNDDKTDDYIAKQERKNDYQKQLIRYRNQKCEQNYLQNIISFLKPQSKKRSSPVFNSKLDNQKEFSRYSGVKKIKSNETRKIQESKGVKEYNYLRKLTKPRNNNDKINEEIKQKQIETNSKCTLKSQKKLSPRQDSIFIEKQSQEESKDLFGRKLAQQIFDFEARFNESSFNFNYSIESESGCGSSEDSSSSNQIGQSNQFELNNNSSQMSKQSTQMIQEEIVTKLNPRRVRHDHREIDDMISRLLDNRMVIMLSTANYIYHALRVANVQIVEDNYEQEDSNDKRGRK